MRASIKKEFGSQKPRAIVLDDHPASLAMIARRMAGRGFDVVKCKSAADFLRVWKPGTADVIIADWQLAPHEDGMGDHVLEQVRRRDWDVPFVLISGQLGDTEERARVLANLLESGGARFVRRGDKGISRACEEAETLIERRDLALLKTILSLRQGALAGAVIQTSSGSLGVDQLLQDVVSKPAASHQAGRPIARARAITKLRS